MKLLTFGLHGKTRYGAMVNGQICDLSARIGDKYKSLQALIEADALPAARMALTQSGPTYDPAEITYHGVLDRAERIFAVGANYPKRNPLGGEFTRAAHPVIFAKTADCLVAHQAALAKPANSERFDYEGELAVVIGRGGRDIPLEDALSHVAGYTCFNDGSVRDFQKHSVWAGKNFVHSGSWGPWMTTADEIADPAALQLTTRINGELTQSAGISEMFFSVPRIISYISSFKPLLPGDVIATGSPERSGDAQALARYLMLGDRIEITIEGIGSLVNSVGDGS